MLYFSAFGLILSEFGVSLKAYLASASILGLAIGFGSQGLVQDVVNGLTVVFSGLFDVGDMVEISGQTGIVSTFGMRFTVIQNAFGAEVSIPNRIITNVVRYPRGYIRGLADITLPDDPQLAKQAEEKVKTIVQATFEQLSGTFVYPPSMEGRIKTSSGKEFLRVKFRLWPGRGSPIETVFKQEVYYALKALDPKYQDCMVTGKYEVDPDFVHALNLLMTLHADHGQNCSTSTVRMVGSSTVNLFSSISAGICALWGALHGGANEECIEMLEAIHADNDNLGKYIDRAKDSNDPFRLMGFGHRVYKNYDPRARIIKQACDTVLGTLGIDDPLLNIARRLEEIALEDSYFVERKLYPNVDFYSGIILRAMGIPVDMFPVMFAMGRMPGWIAQWREVHLSPNPRIYRPRQIYAGPTHRPYVPMDERG